jgi:outer membrane protein TolC
MKRILVFLLACVHIGYGQMKSPDPHKVSQTYTPKADTGRKSDIRERLVQLAMQNPNYEVADRQVIINSYQVRMAKSQWLALMSAQGNLNEFTINQITGSGNAPTYNPYPRYNFGINVPFDVFTRIPSNIKIAKQMYYIAQAEKNDKYRQIREQVLTVYEDYLLAQQNLEFQVQITQNEYTLYRRAEKDYTDGIIKLEEYDKFYRNWTTEQIKRLTLQRDLNVIKLNLERLTGVKIDDITQQNKP